MLALKSIHADKEDTQSLIFDEIDAGISGRTAQSVADRLDVLAMDHQVICITHLPQIAAMADVHYLIEKSVREGSVLSDIRMLSDDEKTEELSRLLSGAQMTDTVRKNAEEMIRLAGENKALRRSEK